MKKAHYLFLMLLLLGGVLVEITFLNIFYADIYLKKGRSFLENGYYYEALLSFDKAIEKNPKESFYYRNRAQAYVSLSKVIEDISYSESLKNLALEDLNTAYSLSPNNLRFLRNSIPIYYLLAEDTEINSTFYVVTKTYFSFLKSKYANDLGVLVDIATYEKKLGWLGDYSNSLAFIEKVRPDILEWYPALLD